MRGRGWIFAKPREFVTMKSSGDQSHQTLLPVVAVPELLPLDDPNLSWGRFEAFCEELISRLPGVKETHRYGRQGSRQRGIDIVADFENGDKWVFQCKQWKKFTKTNATKAIQETSYKADRFILMLSRSATSGVRDVCGSNPNWDVWDVGDISRKVRELPTHSAARLVEAHFGPSWRSAFLGLQGLTSFVTPAEFFRPFLNESALFNHAWQLVGRSDHIRQVHDFVESQQQNVAVLVGRGGIGKSKVLHALADTFDIEHKGMSLWFTAEGVPLTQGGADHLPYEPCVLVVDDAHRRSDLPALLAFSRQRSHATKLLLSCRPQAIDHVRSQLTYGGFDVQEVVFLPAVEELSRQEVTGLARQALGSEFSNLAEQLAVATWDCPLVTVVGGRLVAEKAIAPELLERDEDFRHAVLTRFRDIIVGEVGDRIDTSLCRSLLDVVAAVQPIRLDNETTLDAEAEFLGIDRPALLRSLGVLEEAGVLLRRGNTLRIVPDVLADHILHEVSVTPQGKSTGYADRAFDKFGSLCPSEVLRNLSELDWRLRLSGAPASELLSGIWQKIEYEFRESSNLERVTILRILEQVALNEPERTLTLVEFAMRNPATKTDDSGWSQLYEFTHSDVLRHLPTLLRRISYTLNFLPRCCDLLWELGRDDDGALHAHSDHAMRVLADLGSYDIGKPLAVTHGVLEAVERLLEASDCHDHVHSLLDIVDPMLAKTGNSVYSEGHNLIYRQFFLHGESVKSIRERCISLMVHCLSSDDLRVSLRALKSLEDALREPIGELDPEMSDVDPEQWRAEQLEILSIVEGLAQSATEPLILIRIKDALWWHRSYSPSAEIRDRADAIVASIPESFELRLTQELTSLFHSDNWQFDGASEDDGYPNHLERVEQIHRSVVGEILDRAGSPANAYEMLVSRVQTMTYSGVRPQALVFLGLLGESAPEFAAGICDIMVDDSNGALAPYLQPLLSNVRTWNAERFRGICRSAIKSGSTILCRGVAVSYQSPQWAANASAQDIESIRELLDHGDMGVRVDAIGVLRALAGAYERVAIDLAKSVGVGDSTTLAEELCGLFGGGWGVPFGGLTNSDLHAILAKLEDVPDIGEYEINGFLVNASEQDGGAVVELLLNRIRKEENRTAGYQPLPILGFRERLTGLSGGPDQENILREIRDASLESGGSIGYWIPKLFSEVSSRFDSPAGLQVLDEWINSGDPERIVSGARIVQGAGTGFVLRHVAFVSNLLERAHAASFDCYQSAAQSLEISALYGTRSGTLGQPMPQDIAMKDQASEVANQFDAGSLVHRFYDSLAKIAQARIDDQLQRDEELLE